MFEEYKFLRYFIPGSLFVIYTTSLVLPFLDSAILRYFKNNPNALLGLIGGAFGASLAFGYIIYTFYDTFLYNVIVMKEKKGKLFPERPLLLYIKDRLRPYFEESALRHQEVELEKDWGEQWKKIDRPIKKVFIEMFFITSDNSKDHDKFQTILRGWWSHFSARIVCSICVPIFSFASLLVLFISDIILERNVFAFPISHVGLWLLCVSLIVIISIIIGIGANNPLKESFHFESFFIKSKIGTEVEFKKGKGYQYRTDDNTAFSKMANILFRVVEKNVETKKKISKFRECV